jgi:hypothetical protein
MRQQQVKRLPLHWSTSAKCLLVSELEALALRDRMSAGLACLIPSLQSVTALPGLHNDGGLAPNGSEWCVIHSVSESSKLIKIG